MKSIKSLLAHQSEKGRNRRHINLYALSALVILLSLVTSSAQGAVPPPVPDAPAAADATWDIQVIDGSPSFRFMTDRSLAFKHDDTPCVAFGGDHLYYSCWDAVDKAWKTEVVDSDLLVGSYAALDFDANSRPFISYYDAALGNLKLAYNLGGGWEKLVVDTNPLPPAAPETLLPVEDEVVSPELQDLRELVDSLFSDNLQAVSPQQSEVATLIEDSIGVGKHTSIAIDNTGGVHISYYDEDYRDLKYAYWNGLSWLIETVDAYGDQGGVGTYTSIAVDMYMRPHIAYMSEKYDDLKYARKRGNDWQLYIVDSAANVGTYASLALQEVGDLVYPHISYLDFSNYNLKYAYVDSNGLWKTPALDTNGIVGLYTSIARDPDGKIWISYYDYSNGDLKYARFASGSWSIKTIYSDGNIGLYTSIAIDSNKRPGIIFGDATNNTLHYTYLNEDAKWVASSLGIGSTTDVGMNTSLALNGFGDPIISYRDLTADDLKFARYLTPNWEKSYINPDILAGQHSSTAWIDDYRPAIAFYDQADGDLIYAKWNLISRLWEFQEVDTAGDVGRYVSLAIDPGGNPHMSYLDATYGNLKYAYWNTVTKSWNITPVDAASDVGYYSSLALDESGRPYVSYYDKTNEQIKYAFKTIIDSWVSFPLEKVGLDGDGVIVTEAYTSIALYDADLINPSNHWRMRIAYYNDTLKDVKLAVANTEFPAALADWTISTLDATGDVGKHVSLAIQTETDNRHLCYYDETNSNLRYAGWNGAWAFDVVDSAGEVGQYCSIDLNGLGEPAISYYDAFLGNLKYASTFAMPLSRLYLPVIAKE